FFPLYSGLGAVWSWLAFNPTPSDALAGDVSWLKLGGAKSKLYLNGFSLATSAIGSRYQKPLAGVSPLDFSVGQIDFIGGNASEDFSNPITILGSRVKNGAVNKLTMTFSTASGSFSGKVFDPTTSQPFSFSGVVLQDFGVAAGFFLGTTRSGETFVEPSQ